MSELRIKLAAYIAAWIGGQEYLRGIVWSAALAQWATDTQPQSKIDKIVEDFMSREGML